MLKELIEINKKVNEERSHFFEKEKKWIPRICYNSFKERIEYDSYESFYPIMGSEDLETFYNVDIIFSDENTFKYRDILLYNSYKLYHSLLHEEVFEDFSFCFDVYRKKDLITNKIITFMLCSKDIVNKILNENGYKKNMDYRIDDSSERIVNFLK